MDKTFSLIIPTLNASKELPILLDAIDNQTVKPNEIIVIDSASDDGTPDIARNSDKMKLITIERNDFNHGRTRHKAFLETNGEYVCFLTQDAVPADGDYFYHLLNVVSDRSIAMASGRQLPKPSARRFEQLIRGFNYSSESNVRSLDDVAKYGIKAFFATDVCSIYQRDAYLACGGFEEVNTNEDMLMAARFVRSGYRVAYAADAKVFHSHNFTPKQQFMRNREIGRFLELHSDDLLGATEIGEGSKLATQVASKLIFELQFAELCAFFVDCAARFLGNRAGRKAARLELRA